MKTTKDEKKKISQWKIFAAIAAVLVVFIVLSYAFKGGAGGPGGPGGKNGRRGGGDSVVSVKTQVASVETLHGYVSTNGEVESQNSVSVFPDMGGKVISTSVLLGDKVKKGDVIAYVDPSEPGANYRSSPVYAPISGSVISAPLKNGTKVSTNNAIAIIGDISNLQVTAKVPERYVAVLKNGLKADVKLEAYPDVVFKATVSRVSPVVDSGSRTKEIILHFDSEDKRINAGMFAKVKLYTEDYSGAVVLPVTSLVENADKYYAFVVNRDFTVSKRFVKRGYTVDNMVQILEGVSKDEVVVVQGQTSLADGSKVQDITGSSK